MQWIYIICFSLISAGLLALFGVRPGDFIDALFRSQRKAATLSDELNVLMGTPAKGFFNQDYELKQILKGTGRSDRYEAVKRLSLSVIFMFGCLAPYITFLSARETNDAWYTAVLPVTKRESVLGKCLLVVFFQLFQLLFSVPFALLRNFLNIANNPVGLDATVAWYGFGFIVYAVFDFIFLTTVRVR